MNEDHRETLAEIVPQVTVVASDGRLIGVSVTPYRCTPILSLLDIDRPPWIFARETLPPTTNAWVHAVADFTADTNDYDWDTLRYRELCLDGGLDPDHQRPRFDERHATAGIKLVAALCDTGTWPSHAAVNMVFDLVDVLRVDRWRGAITVESLRQTVAFNARHNPTVVEEAQAMIARATGDDAVATALLGIMTGPTNSEKRNMP